MITEQENKWLTINGQKWHRFPSDGRNYTVVCGKDGEPIVYELLKHETGRLNFFKYNDVKDAEKKS